MKKGTRINKLIQISWIRRLIWKITYEILPRMFSVREWQFMNYGYDPLPEEMEDPTLIKEGFQWRSRAMYHCLASQAYLEGTQVLEVGSGRGGGLAHVAQTFKPAMATGVDFANSAISFSQKTFNEPNLRYLHGDAGNLPFSDDSCDVILNSESCHAYPDLGAFFRECRRVLKPGGKLLLSDFRNQANWKVFHRTLEESGLYVTKSVDITPRVVIALEHDEAEKDARIRNQVSRPFLGLFKEFAGSVGSGTYERFADGEWTYFRFTIQIANN